MAEPEPELSLPGATGGAPLAEEAWSVRRGSLDIARDNITDIEALAAAASSDDQGGAERGGQDHFERARRAMRRGWVGSPRPERDGSRYFVNLATEESRCTAPGDADDNVDTESEETPGQPDCTPTSPAELEGQDSTGMLPDARLASLVSTTVNVRRMIRKKTQFAIRSVEDNLVRLLTDEVDVKVIEGSHGQMELSERRVIDTDASTLAEAKQAKFVRLQTPDIDSFSNLDKGTQLERVEQLRGLAAFIRYSWRLRVPSVIFSITGSATPFALRPKFRNAFSQALVTATRNTNAWVVTGGTASGIMKLVGDGLADQTKQEVAIAIASWGAVHGRTALDTEAEMAPAEAEKLMTRTVRVDGLANERCGVDEQKAEGHPMAKEVKDLFGRFGAVVACSVFQPRTAGTDAPGSAPLFGLVTFQTAKAAARACDDCSVRLDTTGVCLGVAMVGDGCDKSAMDTHWRRIIEGRGTVDHPFVYTGTCEPEKEGPAGARLDPNHSHYVLIDDGTEQTFGSEVALRSELLKFFSFRDDISTCSTSLLTDIVRARPPDEKRSVPVVCLVYGGGVNSFKTIADHMSSHDPVLVIRGSGRGADLIQEWKQLRTDNERARRRGAEPDSESRSLAARTWLTENTAGRKSKRCSLCLWLMKSNECTCGAADAPEMLDAKVQAFMLQLDAIVDYQELYFVDPEKTADRVSTEEQVGVSLLETVLRSIAHSRSVRARVKLPLALRYNDERMVSRILSQEGLELKQGGQEPSLDARPLIFAAFLDQANLVRKLLESGFKESDLDHLIMLELHIACCRIQLRSRKKNDPLTLAPKSWMEQAERRQREISRSSDVPVSAQNEWDRHSPQEQIDIASRHTAMVSWERLPLVPGWTFQVVPTGHKRRGPFHSGATYQLSNTSCRDDGRLVAELVGMAEPFQHCEGSFVSPEEAQQILGEVQVEHFTWSKYMWIKIDEAGPVLLQQMRVDEVTSALPIEGKGGQWPVPSSAEEEALHESACHAFDPWLSFEDISVGKPWWAHLKPRDSKASRPAGDAELDPLLRVFWAVVTRREKLAKLLVDRAPVGLQFVASFLCSYTYRQMPTSTLTQAKASEWDEKALELLEGIERGTHVRAASSLIFDEYVTYGQREEEWARDAVDGERSHYSMLSDEAKRANTNLRAVLRLMKMDEDSPRTRVDLAIHAHNKVFMAHRSTQDWLDRLWTEPSSNGKWLDNLAAWSPKQKYRIHRNFYIGFLALYAAVFVSMPYPHDVDQWSNAAGGFLEWPFWFWIFVNVCYELSQFSEDFGCRFSEYVSGSGNAHDLVITTIFCTAAICRLAAANMVGSGVVGSEVCSDTSACTAFTVAQALLAINFVICALRLLLMFTIHKRIGVLFEICQVILSHDVGPFLLVLVMVICSFEVSTHFFSWVMGQRQWGENGANWWTGFGTYWTVLGLDLDDYYTGGLSYHERNGILEWDVPSKGSVVFQMIFSVLFFLLTTIILMNLLIAMMSDTFGRVYATQEAEWRMKFAKMVREYWDATLTPTPVNLLEMAVNRCQKSKVEAAMFSADRAQKVAWGRHYTWPKPPLHFELHQPSHRLKTVGAADGRRAGDATDDAAAAQAGDRAKDAALAELLRDISAKIDLNFSRLEAAGAARG